MEPDRVVHHLLRMRDRDYPEDPLYRRVLAAFAADERAVAAIAALPDHALAGGLLLSTVHFGVRTGAAGPALIDAWTKELNAPGSTDDLEGLAVAFLTEDGSLVDHLVRTHTGSQLNEIGRCAYLAPALAAVQELRDRPLALLDLGSSAGLTLRFDRYRYDYGGATVGDDAGPTIVPELRGRLPRPLRLADAPWRLGVDRDPIDVRSFEAQQWLLSCIAPHATARADRMRRALLVAATDPPPVVRGDIRDVAMFAAGAPTHLALVVVSTSILMYLSAEDRRAVQANIERMAQDRSVDWLVCEPPHALRALGGGIAELAAPFTDATEFTAPLVHVPHTREPRVLAATGAHGGWIDWW